MEEDYEWQDDLAPKSNKKFKKQDQYADDFENQKHKQQQSIKLPLLNNKSNISLQKSKQNSLNQNSKAKPQQINLQKISQNKKQLKKMNISNANKYKQSHINKIQNTKQLNQHENKIITNQQKQLIDHKLKMDHQQKIKNKKQPRNGFQTINKPQNQNQNQNQNYNQQVQSKYLSYLRKDFPFTKQQLSEFSAQKISRLNDKLKNYIKKVNDQLTDLINENIRILKVNQVDKKNQQQTLTIQKEIHKLMDTKKNRTTYEETLKVQYQQLITKSNQLDHQHLEDRTQSSIKETKLLIKQFTKDIYLIKKQNKDKGNKLSDGQDNIIGQRSTNTKNLFITLTKDQQKNNHRINKLQTSSKQFQLKHQQIDKNLELLYGQLKKNNIQFISVLQGKKKDEKLIQLKKKLQSIKSHKQKVNILNETKLSIARRDNDLTKKQLNQIDQRYSNIQVQVKSIQSNFKQLIKSSLQKQLQPQIRAHLQFFYNNVEQNINFSSLVNKSKGLNRKDSNLRLRKHNSVSNVNIISKSHQKSQMKPSFKIVKKSQFLQSTKQKSILKISQKQSNKRIWKQQQQNKIVEINNLTNKPFTIKKSQTPLKLDRQTKTLKIDIDINNNEYKQNQKSQLIGPKPIKFKPNTSNTNNVVQQTTPLNLVSDLNKNQQTNKQLNKIQQTKQVIKPKFNIKKSVKQKIDIPEQQLYPIKIQSTEKQIEQKNSQIKKQKVNDIVKPQFNIKKQIKQKSLIIQNELQPIKLYPNNSLKAAENTKNQVKIQQQIKQVKQVKLQSAEVAQQAIISGRRQIQRKLKKNTDETYVP